MQTHNIPVWIAPESIHPGEKWVAAINRSLEESGIFLLVLTPDSVKSKWVNRETNVAIELENEGHLQFIPLFLKPCQLPPLWREYQRISFEKDYQAGLRALLSRLGVPTPVMLNEVREVKHPDGGNSAKAQGILRSADYAQNDGGLRKWLATLRSVPIPVWGVVAVMVVLLAWVAYSGLNGDDPSATPTTGVAQNSPASTQPMPPSATSPPPSTETNVPIPSTETNVPIPSTSTSTLAPVSSATPTASRTPPPPAPTATLDPNIPPPNAQQGDTWTRPADSMVMVYVPAGSFLMGSTQAQIDTALAECREIYGDCSSGFYDDEKPQHGVTLDGFWIDRTEVTNEQYGLCVQAGVCEASALAGDNDYNGDNYPVVGVSWNDADVYCQWTEGSLPTEAQWEYAARGPENRIYPWGNEFDGTMLNFCDNNCTYDWKDTTVDDGYELTAPVGSYPGGQSWVGAVDMAGNVWEWVNDWYNEAYYSTSPTENPEGPTETGSTYKVLRGGSWDSYQPILRAAYRGNLTPDSRYGAIGFRCLLRSGN